MTPLIAAIFLASLLGSMHCAGMCGAFLAFAITPGEKPVSKAALQAAYHTGRLVTYTALGTLAGALGHAIDLGGSIAGLQRTAGALAGTMMVAFGLLAIARVMGVRLPRPPVPALMERALTAGHRAAFDLPPLARAAMTGLLTTLLPCGWLYAFVITAAGTANPAQGALAMLVFWLGTLPALIALGTGLQCLAGPLKRRLPLITSLAVVCVGVFTVITRMTGHPHGHALPASAMLLEEHAPNLPAECNP
ncbi:MAG TPA: sulfite exporter TauE/SafE family protein [Phycisphaerales bacterium]|nr:sulfite exporter TauE/SafE family protein [Phycisphaerales bacterium]